MIAVLWGCLVVGLILAGADIAYSFGYSAGKRAEQIRSLQQEIRSHQPP